MKGKNRKRNILKWKRFVLSVLLISEDERDKRSASVQVELQESEKDGKPCSPAVKPKLDTPKAKAHRDGARTRSRDDRAT